MFLVKKMWESVMEDFSNYFDYVEDIVYYLDLLVCDEYLNCIEEIR